jgi:hypothetical protein
MRAAVVLVLVLLSSLSVQGQAKKPIQLDELFAWRAKWRVKLAEAKGNEIATDEIKKKLGEEFKAKYQGKQIVGTGKVVSVNKVKDKTVVIIGRKVTDEQLLKDSIESSSLVCSVTCDPKTTDLTALRKGDVVTVQGICGMTSVYIENGIIKK